MKEWIKHLIERLGNLGTRKLQEQTLPILQDIKATLLLPDLAVDYIPWSSFALRPSALTMILNEIVLNRRQTIIECGVGISTLHILGSGISDNIQLIGIDDDEEWINLVKSYLDKMGVSQERYHLIHAPIVDQGDSTRRWYDVIKINQQIDLILGGNKADMLIVDGPKGSLCKESRYPALPSLVKYLNDDSTVFLDDIHRHDEYHIAALWRNEFDLDLSYHLDKGGMAILRSSCSNGNRTVS